jgi:hypothetical protein
MACTVDEELGLINDNLHNIRVAVAHIHSGNARHKVQVLTSFEIVKIYSLTIFEGDIRVSIDSRGTGSMIAVNYSNFLAHFSSLLILPLTIISTISSRFSIKDGLLWMA